MRISDWSSDVCSSDLRKAAPSTSNILGARPCTPMTAWVRSGPVRSCRTPACKSHQGPIAWLQSPWTSADSGLSPKVPSPSLLNQNLSRRSEEHTYELQSLMRISYAVFCLKKKIHTHH